MIEVKDLNKTYDRKSRNRNHVLKDISITLPDTGFVCIVGVSGCGKTSLLNAVGGLDTFDSGKITVHGTAVSRPGTRAYERERNNSFGYIFQNYYLLSGHSVAYNVYLGLHSLDLTHSERLARVKEALEAVNMSRYSLRIVGELSGGQQQRVAIARALARRPRVIFADEPTGNLDEENTVNICTILRRISRTSLVVMVTHEDRIARFFADRIIMLGEGKILEDSTSWQRKNLTAGMGSILYTEDYQCSEYESEEMKIRILTEEDADPVNLTIAVLRDRIIIKSDDSRTISCSKLKEPPVLKEGRSPEITPEETDSNFPQWEQDVPAEAGSGFPFSMMLEEAGRLMRRAGIQKRGILFFLVAMTVLTIWMVGDYLTVSSVDPRDFVTTDSHILNLSAERGKDLDPHETVKDIMQEFIADMKASGVEFEILPYVGSATASFSLGLLPQLNGISVKLEKFSYAPVEQLDEEKLLYGRMPENSEEIVIDRWVLEYAVGKDGVLQNGIQDIRQLLDRQVDYFKRKYSAVIVGICDCDDPAIYLSMSALASVGNMGTELITFSEFQERFPGLYDGETLKKDECIVITNNAGYAYANKIGSLFRTNSNRVYTIVHALQADTYASIVIADEALEDILISMNNQDYTFYARDKEGLKKVITGLMEGDYKGLLQYRLKDINGDAQKVYRKAASMKADARTIVTFTIIALSMIMLYLLQRSYVQQRIGMMAVYRLLGMPGRKLLGIFSMESLMLSLESVLPAAAVTWTVVAVLNLLTDLNFSMILPWQAAGIVCMGIMAYYMLICLLPVCRLLRMPPARLAARYDI